MVDPVVVAHVVVIVVVPVEWTRSLWYLYGPFQHRWHGVVLHRAKINPSPASLAAIGVGAIVGGAVQILQVSQQLKAPVDGRKVSLRGETK